MNRGEKKARLETQEHQFVTTEAKASEWRQ